MTFKELNELVVAIRVKKNCFDFKTRVAEMILTPEYGVDATLKGKNFKLEFKDCLFYGSLNQKQLNRENGQEFILWGERALNDNEYDVLFDLMTEKRGPASMARKWVRSQPRSYRCYFFENAFGDSLKIVCSDVIVEES